MNQNRRGGLGRGLAALIPTGPTNAPQLGNAAADLIIGGESRAATPLVAHADPLVDVSHETLQQESSPRGVDHEVPQVGAVYREINPGLIDPNPKQPRQVFDEDALDELIHSIREFGMMQPIVVRPHGQRFQLVMGERRWRAGLALQLSTVPVIVRETADQSLLRDALLENIHRVQLNPLEEAAAYQQLLEEFDVTHDELAGRLGRSRPVVTNMIRLLKLPIAVQRRVAAGVLSAGHARALLGVTRGAEAQENLAARIVAEGLSVRATEEAVILLNRGTEQPLPHDQKKPASQPRPELDTVAHHLSDSFDTKVTVSLGKRKGKIVVEFGSVEDLERIVSLMGTAN
ncbi:ParB/RepB/Spo0J family partition protein [Hoyosella rhizosphaerae]|uniref:Chromosome partitioning protein ParB n=1 Tax=Hoyosella rhizosphaerae TaxID=1755582 RepID=A0A916XE89_9ACTN|nr:ParB/RepB/Spo0J family partition protein [Hoyosella rhizosphaerae]MBN4927487.1 ParB/RepB/Spo0J family partition protein [Hoyosella rhizosphaerae]GGC64078.1 chromosome partitioning protein ParB [Hoyosella rhizosphaerae]